MQLLRALGNGKLFLGKVGACAKAKLLLLFLDLADTFQKGLLLREQADTLFDLYGFGDEKLCDGKGFIFPVLFGLISVHFCVFQLCLLILQRIPLPIGNIIHKGFHAACGFDCTGKERTADTC